MEYEIEDEAGLFDDSTNPSLKRRREGRGRVIELRDRRRLQTAEVIPDEEDQAA